MEPFRIKNTSSSFSMDFDRPRLAHLGIAVFSVWIGRTSLALFFHKNEFRWLFDDIQVYIFPFERPLPQTTCEPQPSLFRKDLPTDDVIRIKMAPKQRYVQIWKRCQKIRKWTVSRFFIAASLVKDTIQLFSKASEVLRYVGVTTRSLTRQCVLVSVSLWIRCFVLLLFWEGESRISI